MEAQISIKMNPQEFDLLRQALGTFSIVMRDKQTRRECDAKERSEARALEARTRDLLEKLR